MLDLYKKVEEIQTMGLKEVESLLLTVSMSGLDEETKRLLSSHLDDRLEELQSVISPNADVCDDSMFDVMRSK